MAQHELERLLDAHAAGDPSAEARILERFTRWRAVLISDMSGFSKLTRDHGIVHFLAMVQRMRRLCRDVIETHGGALVKAEADNLFAVFDDPADALRAAFAMHTAVRRDGDGRPAHAAIALSIGIGWGEVLDLDGHDYYGHEVNLASKLGEDVAEPGETLLSQAAADATRPVWEGLAVSWRDVEVSGVHFHLLAVVG